MPEPSFEIREFVEADRQGVAALWRLTFPGDPPRNEPDLIIDRKLRTQPELFLVACLDGRVAGAVLGGYDGFRGWAYHLAVHPDFQRRGFGRQLMKVMEQRLLAHGCPKLNLQVRAHNAEVIRFYEHLGYSVEDHVSLGKVLTQA